MLLRNANPVSLKGLKQEAFVLRSLEKGIDSHELVESFGGDEQLVDIWTSFLIHNGWIDKIEVDGGSTEYLVTDKGREWIDRLDDLPADNSIRRGDQSE